MIQKNLEALNVLWGNLFKDFGKDEKESLIKIFRSVPLFQDLSTRELRAISHIMYERRFEAGEYMFEYGQPGAAMFVLLEGEVKILKTTQENEEVELATLREGEFLGELALLDSSPRSASALATQRTVAMAIFREDLNKMLETQPELGGKVMRRLAVIIGVRLKATNNLLMVKEQELNESRQD